MSGPETAALLQAGKLEQTCPDCGRWEAAHWYCSWCLRPMGPPDWYLNGDTRERHGRRPTAAPANVPSEYGDKREWPEAWGPYPFEKGSQQAPRTTGTPVKRGPASERRVSGPTARADGTLGLL